MLKFKLNKDMKLNKLIKQHFYYNCFKNIHWDLLYQPMSIYLQEKQKYSLNKYL